MSLRRVAGVGMKLDDSAAVAADVRWAQDSGDTGADVLCVFDADPDEPGDVYALLLTDPTAEPAQPLAFGLFRCGDDVVWWGWDGPTDEPFALVRLPGDVAHEPFVS